MSKRWIALGVATLAVIAGFATGFFHREAEGVVELCERFGKDI